MPEKWDTLSTLIFYRDGDSEMQKENIKILIVDDPDIISKMIRPTLVKQLGFASQNIIEANSGKKALDILNTIQIDLVLCEWNIPEVSGLELLKIVRKHETLSSLPFMMVTSVSDQKCILQAAQEKVTQYVVKPFTVESFSININQALLSTEQRAHKRYQVTKSNELTVLSNGTAYTAGKIINFSKGGLLAKLFVKREITIYDKLDLMISIVDSPSGKKFTNSIQGELIRIERTADNTPKKIGYYSFVFTNLDQAQKKFLETIVLLLER